MTAYISSARYYNYFFFVPLLIFFFFFNKNKKKMPLSFHQLRSCKISTISFDGGSHSTLYYSIHIFRASSFKFTLPFKNSTKAKLFKKNFFHNFYLPEVKFIYSSEKVTKFCEISTVDLTGTTWNKSIVEIL